jgi:hypothetical protein
MIGQIKEFGTKLRVESLSEPRILNNREVKIMEARSAHSVSAQVSEGKHSVRLERARVDPAINGVWLGFGACMATTAKRISNEIGAIVSQPSAAVVASCQDREGLPSLHGQDSAELPAVCNDTGEGRNHKLPGWHFVHIAETQSVFNVEIRYTPLGSQVVIVLRKDSCAIGAGPEENGSAVN